MRILILSVTPSPYQRDLFRALALKENLTVQVAYYEKAADDSPWRLETLDAWESVMPGGVWGKGRVRCHWNHPLPDVMAFDRVIVNAPLTALTTQIIFRKLSAAHSPPWFFWGERLLARKGCRGYFQKLLAAPIKSARSIVAIGSLAREDYQARFPGSIIHDIPYACDLSHFQEAANHRVTHPACRFLFVGQMIARKGVDVLLAAFSRLVEEGHPVELHLVGREGELPQWLSALRPGVLAHIKNIGFLQPEELPKVFMNADVFVFPSRHDGWGVVVNQALGAGLPVITSTAAGAGRDLVKDGIEGIHVPPGEVEPLLEAMRELAVNSNLRMHQGAAAAAKSAGLSPDAAAGKWVEVLSAPGGPTSPGNQT